MIDAPEDMARYFRYDWAYAPTRWDKLHSIADATYDTDAWRAAGVTFACGWKVDAAYIPGIFSRMALPRCAFCCDRLGYPRGVGSPKNDQACRALLELEPSR